MITVGTTSFSYNQVRNFSGLQMPGIRFKEVYDLNKLEAFVRYKVTGKIDYRKLNRFNDWGVNRVDMYHFFNGITPVKKPWLVTYETSLPRLDESFRQGYEWLAGPYCRRIIAMTKRAFDIQRNQLQRFPEIARQIENKLEIISPAQRVLTPAILERKDPRVVFTFAGSAFYRKGGWEMLRAFSRLAEERDDFHLNVVSDLRVEGFCEDHVTKAVIQEVGELLNKNWVTHRTRVSNAAVLELFRNSDVGLLPSYSETYGYSLLEAMACGCAVIAPGFAPFDEFVDNTRGWVLDLPVVVSAGVSKGDFEGARSAEFSAALERQLLTCLRDACSSRANLDSKRSSALTYISKHHDPEERAGRLKKIYLEALN